MKAIVVAGGVAQAALITELKARGIYTILVDRNPKAYAVPYADAFFPISTMDIDGIRQLAIDQQADMVLSACADQVLLVCAKVSEDLGLPSYIDYETAKTVSDKELMKERFVRFGIPTAHHVVMAELDMEKLTGFEYPLIVKPVDCYSSRGVRKVENEEELRAAFADAVRLSRTDTALVEEFCEGIELTVDAYVEGGIAHVLTTSVSEKTGEENRFVIYRTLNPAPVSETIMVQVKDACQKIAEAFGLVDSPMLVQMIADENKINVLEFCARTGGCIKFRLIQKASGFDVIKAAADLVLGLKPHVEELKSENRYISNTFLYSKPGIFDHLEGFEEAKAAGLITDYVNFSAPGREFDTVTCSGDRLACFTVQGDDLPALQEAYRKALAMISALDTEGNDMIRRDFIRELNF